MSRILIADCAPAAWENELEARGARNNATTFEDVLRLHTPNTLCCLLHLADDADLPNGTTIADFDGVVFTGSPLHINDTARAVQRQVDFARAVFATGVPCWGSCWGLQLATVALGGSVRLTARGREIGVARGIATNEAGRTHPMLSGRPAVFDALCTHSDEVDALPPGANVLAGNTVSAIQAATMPTPGGGGFWGVQYHPEINLAYVAAVMRARAPRLVAEGFARTEAALLATADDFAALGDDRERRDLAWQYGISDAILDPIQHSIEIGNWLRTEVRPR